MPHGYTVPHAGTLWQPLDDPVLQAEPPALSQHRHGGAGELLSNRARLIDGTVTGRYAQLDICQSKSPVKQDAVSTKNHHRHPGDMLPLHFIGDVAIDGVKCETLSVEHPAPGQNQSQRQQHSFHADITRPGPAAWK